MATRKPTIASETAKIRTQVQRKKIKNKPLLDSAGNPLIEANQGFNSNVFFGSEYSPGLYYEIRYNYSLVDKIMTDRVARVRNTKWKLTPCNDSISAKNACESVNTLLSRLTEGSLGTLIGRHYDYFHTYGFCIAEIVATHNDLQFVFIEPAKIEFDQQEARERDKPTKAFISDTNRVELKLDKCWYTTRGTSNSWYGNSELRSVVADFTIYSNITQAYLRGISVAAGIPYMQENDGDSMNSVSQDSVEEALDWLADVLGGNPSASWIPRGLSPNVLSIDNPASGVEGMLKHYQDQTREKLGSMLGSLGDNGSRALGDAFIEQEQSQWKDHLNDYVAVLNNKNEYGLLEKLTEVCGYSLDNRPRLEVERVETIRIAEKHDAILKMVSAGLVQLQPEDLKMIRKELGLVEPTTTKDTPEEGT